MRDALAALSRRSPFAVSNYKVCAHILHTATCTNAAVVRAGSGHIVNITSDAGRRVFPTLAVYCGTKFFVEAMTEGMRRELVGTGIRVTNIQPGDVATDLIMNNTDKG
jgi:NADP-dependent 3-hydroxy acid dehydrogenase YdfG